MGGTAPVVEPPTKTRGQFRISL